MKQYEWDENQSKRLRVVARMPKTLDPDKLEAHLRRLVRNLEINVEGLFLVARWRDGGDGSRRALKTELHPDGLLAARRKLLKGTIFQVLWDRDPIVQAAVAATAKKR